ncbi:hypothetical protein M422DRAFT_195736, partial [Sphaerobolus stellatus SS14]
VLNLCSLEFALLWLEVELVFLQALDNFINIDAYNPFQYKVMEDVIHHSLKGCRTIAESKKHYQWFKQASIRPEGHLPLISFFNVHIIVAPLDVQFGEILCPAELVD